MADGSVILIELIEFAFLEKYDGIPKFLLDLPVLLFEWREIVPSEWWYVDSSRIVVWVTRRVPIRISYFG